jgi:hypothetical protein
VHGESPAGGEGNSFFNRDLVRVDGFRADSVSVARVAEVGGVHFIRNAVRPALPAFITRGGGVGRLAVSTQATTTFSPSRSARSLRERLRPAVVFEP